MRSHLTRNVCRRLLAPQGSLLPCPAVSSLARHQLRQPRSVIRRPSRRTFFGVFQKPPRELKEVTIEPGYEALLQYRASEFQGHQLPSRRQLLQGFRNFFQHKVKYRKPVNSTQALLAVRLLRHLIETDGDGEPLTLEDLRLARDALLKPPKKTSADHLELAKTLYEQIRELTVAIPGSVEEPTESTNQNVGGEASAQDFQGYIACLTLYGGSLDAATRLEEYWTSLQDDGTLYRGAKFLWVLVLRGLAREGREEELVHQYEKAEKLGVELLPTIHEVMVSFFATRDKIEETKRWFERPIHANWLPQPETYLAVLNFSIRNSQQEWVSPIFEKLMEAKPGKVLWNVIFQWAVLVQNKGVEDIKHMMETAVSRRDQEEKPVKLDVAMMNDLVSAAIEKKDPYLAERFISFGAEMGVTPNARTGILQMDYRIEAKDLSGAAAAYQKLEASYITDDEDLPVVNKYIRALCAANKPDTDRILEVTRNLEDRGAILEPETVVSICIVFLKADQEFEVIDTLSVHTTNYSLEERDKVEKAFVAYCLDKKNSTARVWDTYTLLRQFFPEADPEDRVLLMNNFFERKRPDMACYIFGHMRANTNSTQRPTRDVYIRCFEELGKHPDIDSLRMVHNMLKMDTTIQPDTKLYNALMIAYLGCGAPSKAFEFWTDITNSIEGPTYNSLAIVFQVCQMIPWGDRKARDIWHKMQKMDLDVPQYVFSAYCASIAGQGRVEEVQKLIQGSEFDANLLTLGLAYNALPGLYLQEEFEGWAKQEYPEIWARLLEKGRRTNRIENLSKFNISQQLTA